MPEQNTNNSNLEDAILIVNMFSGSYPTDNIAHEIINLFKSDEVEDRDYSGCHYLYVPWNGHCNSKANKVLMVRHIGSGEYEVLARAKVKKAMEKSIDEQNKAIERIKYDEKSIEEIFAAVGKPFKRGETFNECELLSFEVENAKRPLFPIIIKSMNEQKEEKKKATGKEHEEDEICEIVVKSYSKNGKLKDLISRQHETVKDDLGDKQKDDTRYKELVKLFATDENWEELRPLNESDLLSEDNKRHGRFLSLINKEDSELAYSNLLAHFLNENDKLGSRFIEFLWKISNIGDPSDADLVLLDVFREKMHIDLLINTKSVLFILENKVNARLDEDELFSVNNDNDDIQQDKRYKLSGEQLKPNEKYAGGQLQRYIDKLPNEIKEGKERILVFIICPSRNKLYKDYLEYKESKGKNGLLRKVWLDEEGKKLCAVPVISYKNILDVLSGTPDYTPGDPLPNVRGERDKGYFRDFMDMLYWQETDEHNSTI